MYSNLCSERDFVPLVQNPHPLCHRPSVDTTFFVSLAASPSLFFFLRKEIKNLEYFHKRRLPCANALWETLSSFRVIPSLLVRILFTSLDGI